jgi:hypothetical protein
MLRYNKIIIIIIIIIIIMSDFGTINHASLHLDTDTATDRHRPITSS